ncbi:MAG: ketoacyl-ACP synthase III [Myxococcota bacterium]
MSLYLHGLGHAHPEAEISNRFLESLDIGTSDEWILERVGIRSRRSVMPLDYIRTTRNRDPREALDAATDNNASLGARAARMAIARAGITDTEIGLVLSGNSATDTSGAPAEACNVAAALGLDTPALDVSSACTSFFAQLYFLSLMDPAKLPPYVLLVAPETLSTTVDYEDRATAVLWGDAAAAGIVSTRVSAPAEIVANALASQPSGRDKVVVPRGRHFRQEGRTVQMFGIKKMVAAVERLRDELEVPTRRLHFVGHQANLRMLERVRDLAEIPTERHHTNVEWYGNTGAASAASVLSMEWEKWRPGDDVAVAGVGAGLTWSSYGVRFVGESA